MRRMAIALTACALALPGCPRKPTPPPEVPPKAYYEANTIYRCLAASYGPAVQATKDSSVDWSGGFVIATGTGVAADKTPQQKLLAGRAAEQTALRNAALVAAGLPVGADGRTVELAKGKVTASGQIASREILQTKWDADTLTATAVVRVPLYGLNAVVRLDGVALPKVDKPHEWAAAEPYAPEADLLIVDARGTGFRPCLLPRLAAEDGAVIFDPSELSPEALRTRHVAVYVAGLRTASSSAASSPAAADLDRRIELRASGVLPGMPGALVLDKAEMAKLAPHLDAHALLEAGRLVIVVDPEP